MADRKYGQVAIERTRVYLNFLLARARGQVKTGARVIRDFVMSHPAYKHDSIIPNEIAYDLVKSIFTYTDQQASESHQNGDVEKSGLGAASGWE